MMLVFVRNQSYNVHCTCCTMEEQHITSDHRQTFYDSLEKEKEDTGRNHKDKKYIDNELYLKTIKAVESRKYEKCPTGDAHFKDWARKFTVETNHDGEKVLLSNPDKLAENRRKQEQQRKKKEKGGNSDEENFKDGSNRRRKTVHRKLPVLKYEDYFTEIKKCHKEAGHIMENTWKLVSEQWFFVTKKTVQLFCEACKGCRTAPKKRKISSCFGSSHHAEAKQARSCFSSASSTDSSSQIDEQYLSGESSPSLSQSVPNQDLIAHIEGVDQDRQTSMELHPSNTDVPSDLQGVVLTPMPGLDRATLPCLPTDPSGPFVTCAGDCFASLNAGTTECCPTHDDVPATQADFPYVQDSCKSSFVVTCESLTPRPISRDFVRYTQPQTTLSKLVRVPLTQSCSFQPGNFGNLTGVSSSSLRCRFNLDFSTIQNTQLGEVQVQIPASTAANTVSPALSTTSSMTSLAGDQSFGSADYTDLTESGSYSFTEIPYPPTESFIPCQATPRIHDAEATPRIHDSQATSRIHGVQMPKLDIQQAMGQISNLEQRKKETSQSSTLRFCHQFPDSRAVTSKLKVSHRLPDQQVNPIFPVTEPDLGTEGSRGMQYLSPKDINMRSFIADTVDPTGSVSHHGVVPTTDASVGISLKESKTLVEKTDGEGFLLICGSASQVNDDLVHPSDIDLLYSRSAGSDLIPCMSSEENTSDFHEVNPSLRGANTSSTQSQDWTETPSSTQSLTSKLPIDPAQQIRLFGEIQAALTADEDGDIPLHLAVVHEHLPLVQKFIQLMKIARRSVDRFNKDKQTPLHLAVKLNFVPGVKALLAAGADVNFVDKTGCTSLHLAVKHQLPECLKLLVDGSKVEADFNTRNFEGLTPLHTAVELRNMKLMAYILDHRADINMMDGKSGRTPLFHAAENNQEDVVEFLLKRGANPDVLNYAGSTAMMAAQARNYNHVTKMLSRASDWNDEDRSGSSSPASEIGVYLPEVVKPNMPGMWKHSMPLRNPATFNTVTGTFVGSPSASTVEVSLTTQAPRKSKFIESVHQVGSKSPSRATKPGDGSNPDVEMKTTVSLPVKIPLQARSETVSNTSEVMSRPSERAPHPTNLIVNTADVTTPESKTVPHSCNTVSQTSAEAHSSPDSGRTESAKSKSDSVSWSEKGMPQSYNTGQNSEYNMSANIRAIGELARTSPAVALQLQKLFEAKQKAHMASMKSSTGDEKSSPINAKESESDAAESCPESKTRPPMSSTPPGSKTQTSQPSMMSQPLATSPPTVMSAPTESSPLRTSYSPGTTESGVTTPPNMNTLIPSTVTRPESNIPRVVSAPSQVIGKVSHVVEKLPQQPERIISTGMVVEHPEYGLVFRPFGPGQIQRLNQPGSVPRTSANPERKETEPARPEKDTPSEVTDNSEEDVTKPSEMIVESSVSTKTTEAEEVKASANSSKTTIPTVKETVSSYPVTEKLLNSKPKTIAIPKSRPTESSLKTQESVSKPETGSAVIKSIANSAIAAKLRQRVLNSPQVDSAAKLAANSPVHTTTTVKSSGAVMTAPERVPKLPQFGSRPANTTPDSAPTVNPENVSKHQKGVSRIIAHLSKPIELNRPALDLTKVKSEKVKKSEKRKKKETNGNGAGLKKKSAVSQKDDKQDETEDSGISEPMDMT